MINAFKMAMTMKRYLYRFHCRKKLHIAFHWIINGVAQVIISLHALNVKVISMRIVYGTKNACPCWILSFTHTNWNCGDYSKISCALYDLFGYACLSLRYKFCRYVESFIIFIILYYDKFLTQYFFYKF